MKCKKCSTKFRRSAWFPEEVCPECGWRWPSRKVLLFGLAFYPIGLLLMLLIWLIWDYWLVAGVIIFGFGALIEGIRYSQATATRKRIGYQG